MPEYDVTRLPQPVQEALLQLVEALLQTEAPAGDEPVPAAPATGARVRGRLTVYRGRQKIRPNTEERGRGEDAGSEKPLTP